MISVDGLVRTYGDFTAIDNVSFKIGQGEIVGLLGHNGAGKTTIMKMLTGFLEPTDGSITVDGLDINREREAIQRKIGYLPENCPVYPEMTVIDYLNYAAALHGVSETERLSRVREAIAKTELSGKATQLINTLSRGYRQRVGVAQSLLHHPDILILDEPTNGLDPSQVQHMRDLIREVAQHATVILSTHILQEVQAICDRVIIIRAGKKVMDSRMEELRSAHRLLVTVQAEPGKVDAALKEVAVVQSVEQLANDDNRQSYALEFRDQAEPQQCAPAVASALLGQGCALYAMQPEQRTLESIFLETAAQ
ncbi:MAG TPA: ABC transporter ATP-binding protein [Gammaproteobacteria bacterium]|nr:ABC transporter ATP-binding protein [Gammaproteobacteria bacterium]